MDGYICWNTTVSDMIIDEENWTLADCKRGQQFCHCCPEVGCCDNTTLAGQAARRMRRNEDMNHPANKMYHNFVDTMTAYYKDKRGHAAVSGELVDRVQELLLINKSLAQDMAHWQKEADKFEDLMRDARGVLHRRNAAIRNWQAQHEETLRAMNHWRSKATKYDEFETKWYCPECTSFVWANGDRECYICKTTVTTMRWLKMAADRMDGNKQGLTSGCSDND